MKLTDEEFKRFQKKWYKRLRHEGFWDIELPDNYFVEWISEEDPEIVERSTKVYEQIAAGSQQRIIKEEYWTLIRHAVEDEKTNYRNLLDKFIMRLYAEGTKIIDIVRNLASLGIKRDKKTIRILIRRYEMAWKIKFYTRKQLNLK